MVGSQTILHGLRLVILADGQLFAADIADAFLLGGVGNDVVGSAAGQAGAPAGHALFYFLIADFQGNHMVKVDACCFQGFRLSDGAGHAVQDVAVLAVRLLKPFGDDADDDFVRNQLAGIHILLGLQTYGGAVLDGGPQDVAGGDGRNVQLFADDLSLRALAGAGSAQQDQFHNNLPP